MKCDNIETHCTPPDVANAANNIMAELLPKKSRKRYEDVYDKFMVWKQKSNIPNFSENVLLAYFGELKNKYKSSTLWSIYSMLKSTLELKQDVKLDSYLKLKALLKRASENYEVKKSKTLTSAELHKFIQEAPDDKYLLMKVVLAISISGACRRDELWKIKLENIKDMGSALLIKLPDTKTKTVRTFTVADEFYNLCKRYMSLRPQNCEETRLFLNYQHGKCTRQPVGINKIGAMPQKIASFLKLANPEAYTGHCFRRSSATILVDAGADLLTLKRHGGWRSSTVAEAYVDDSVQSKLNISKKIMDSINVQSSNQCSSSVKNPVNLPAGLPSTSKDSTTHICEDDASKENSADTVIENKTTELEFCNEVIIGQTSQRQLPQPISITNCHHMTINITNNLGRY